MFTDFVDECKAVKALSDEAASTMASSSVFTVEGRPIPIAAAA